MIRIAATALLALLALAATPALAAKPARKAEKLDLATPDGANEAARRMQCSSGDGEQTLYWFHGEGFSRVPGEKDRKLFHVEGMNVRTCVTVQDEKRGRGWRLVSRELLLYTDPATGELLKTWNNPWTGQTVNVLQTANDPVNQRAVFPLGADGKPAAWAATVRGGTWWRTLTVPLFYTNPLGGPYQKYVGGSYHATEMFNFFGRLDELVDLRIADPAVEVGWVRLASWLPRMEMGDRAGMVYIHAAGRKVARFEDLPEPMRRAIETTYPEYRSPPPGDDSRQNETSWTYFQKKIPPSNAIPAPPK